MLGKLKLKYIQSLGQKKVRDEEGLFIAEGPKLVAELILSGKMVTKQLYALPEWIDENAPVAGNIETVAVNEDELKKISQLSTPNKVVAIVKKIDPPTGITTKGTITLALDTLQDPGNLGTIIRIADWFGINQVVCSNDSADIYNPKVVQSTMGSIMRVNVIYTNLVSWLSTQKDVRIYAASLEGQDITATKKMNEGIIIIGNESKGISEDIMKLANVKITIPKKGKAESLNAAVATGIILSHLI